MKVNDLQVKLGVYMSLKEVFIYWNASRESEAVLGVMRVPGRLALEQGHCHYYKDKKGITRDPGYPGFPSRASARGANTRTRALRKKSTRREGNNRTRT